MYRVQAGGVRGAGDPAERGPQHSQVLRDGALLRGRANHGKCIQVWYCMSTVSCPIFIVYSLSVNGQED